MMHTIMLSGGVDSTGMLFYLINKLDPEMDWIHIHHVVMKDRWERYKPEGKAVEAITSYVRYLTPYGKELTTSTSMWEMKLSHYYHYDTAIIGMAAAIACIENILAYGMTQLAYVSDTATDLTELESNNIKDRLEQQRLIFNSYFAAWDQTRPDIPKLISPVENLSKQELWNWIPSDLHEYIWSCRHPRIVSENSFLECGACFACAAKRKVEG